MIVSPSTRLATNPSGCLEVGNPIHSTFEVGESLAQSWAHEQGPSLGIAQHPLDMLQQQIVAIEVMLGAPTTV